MSPFFAKISLIICAAIIFSSFVCILNKIHATKEDWKSDQTHGLWRQHGDYWVWHDYIRRSDDFKNKESITLTTHGTYMDLGLLPELLVRWQAPISLAIYASGSDFDKTIESLTYLNVCQKQYKLMRRFLSIHLVIHNLHIPKNLQRFAVTRDLCGKPAPFKKMQQQLTYWHKMKLSYPVNLLRNIARYNAPTYYIMALDLQLIPTPNFVKKFLQFIRLGYRFKSDKQQSLYCLPTFPHKLNTALAETKDQLAKNLKEFNINNAIYNPHELQEKWLLSQYAKNKLSIFMSSSKMNMCVGYVSINELEPLYDERCDMESIYDKGTNLKAQVLVAQNYTFKILNGAFLIHRALDSWKSMDMSKNQTQTNLHLSHTWLKFYDGLLKPETAVQRKNLKRFNHH